MTTFRSITIGVFVVCASGLCATEDVLVVPGLSGRPGGRLVYGQRAEPKTLNPVFASDPASREVIQRLMADLIHINRVTLKTEPGARQIVESVRRRAPI